MERQKKNQQRRAAKNEPVTLNLPRLFPSMTRPDIITVLSWNYKVGDILPLDPSQCLLTVTCCYGEGSLLIPDFLCGPHRIVEILKPAGATMQLGDPLFVLEPVADSKNPAA